MTALTPREIVTELDRHIIGQADAKRAVAIALRNRWRRQQVVGALKDEILPKNILMIGPTGVGKTEIARRLAKLAAAPFIKVEATKFTEVGYVGRDVDQIIRDLMESAIALVREEMRAEVKAQAELAAENRVLDALVGATATEGTRESFRKRLRSGELNEKMIDIQIQEPPPNPFAQLDIPGMQGAQMGMLNLGEIFGKGMGSRTKPKRMTVRDSYTVLVGEESDKLLDDEQVTRTALERVENAGIVFLDEVDKITARSDMKGGDVSREGVQRDLLPLIEGTTVSTKYGPVKTDHILFIASGAFHVARPSDLLPELQGRLPIRVELQPLTEADFRRILTEPQASLIAQYQALLKVEGVELVVQEDGIAALARIAAEVNQSVENIGARRLQTVLERVLDDASYSASDRPGQTVTVDEAYVQEQMGEVAADQDLSRYIL